ncbi:unnamed protein product, partial [Rotaria magnacalcarata]
MELLFVLCLLFARQANSENVHDKQEFEWNNTMSTMEKYFELTTPFYYNLTSTDDMMVNVTPEINLSPPVKRV